MKRYCGNSECEICTIWGGKEEKHEGKGSGESRGGWSMYKMVKKVKEREGRRRGDQDEDKKQCGCMYLYLYACLIMDAWYEKKGM